MSSDDALGYLKILGIIAGILSFIADLVTLLQIFGINFIIAPSTNPISPQTQPLVLKPSASAEVITFLLWLYTAIVVVVVSIAVVKSYDPGWFGFLPGPFCALVPILFVIWLWGFGHIPAWLYIFLLPTTAFMGIAWYAGLGVGGRQDVVFYSGSVLLLIAIGPAVIWFRSVYDWSFFWIIAISFASLLIGSAIGFGSGRALTEWLYWLL